MKTTSSQRNSIQEKIQIELLKRGFTAQIVNFEEVSGRGNDTRLEFNTTSFQTVPVIFKEIIVCNFSSSLVEEQITNENGIFNTVRVWLSVHVSYKSFEGGSNGNKLFDFTCGLVGDSDYLQDLNIF